MSGLHIVAQAGNPSPSLSKKCALYSLIYSKHIEIINASFTEIEIGKRGKMLQDSADKADFFFSFSFYHMISVRISLNMKANKSLHTLHRLPGCSSSQSMVAPSLKIWDVQWAETWKVTCMGSGVSTKFPF